MDILCLVIWILNTVLAVNAMVNNEQISPVVTICALIVCVLHYLERIMRR